MRINRLVSNSVEGNLELDSKSQLLKGEILESKGNNVLIRLKSGKIIEAKSEINLSEFIGLEIAFNVLIDSKDNINLTLSDELSKVDLDYKIKELLDLFSIPENKLNLEIVKRMMKNNIYISEENIVKNIKVLNKLMELQDLKIEDEIELIIKENDCNIDDEILNKNEPLDINSGEFRKYLDRVNIEMETDLINVSQEIKESVVNYFINEINRKNNHLESINIKNILIKSNKTENKYGKKEIDKKQNLLAKEIISYIDNVTNNLSREKILDLVVFLSKYELEPSLKNIKTILELDKSIMEFLSKLETFDDSLNEIIEESLEYSFKKDDIKNFSLYLQKNIEDNLENKLNLKEVLRKIEFLKNINKEVYFYTIPLTYGKEKFKGALNIVKNKNKQKELGDKHYSIFITLDTNELGLIMTHIKFDNQTLNIQVNVLEEDLYLFKMGKETLIKRISNIGYIVDSLDFIVKENLSILDFDKLVSDEINIIDIRV